MGTHAARITPADFLTPPELADRRLAAEGSGRIGGARVALTVAGGQTRLGDCYQQVPLRVHAFAFAPTQPALIYLLNPTAGLLDGDGQLVEIKAGPDTRAVVTGQSATRIHPCLQGFATQQWRVRVGRGGVLVVLPGPAIPFHNSRYYQDVEIDLASDAHIVWGDLWTAGRYARGEDSERFRFHTLVQHLLVRRADRPCFRERFCWRGPWSDRTAFWHFADAPACGNLFSTLPLTAELVDDCGPSMSAFTTSAGHACIRWLGPVQEVTMALARTALGLGARAAGSGHPWLSSAELAPTHWFTGQSILQTSTPQTERGVG